MLGERQSFEPSTARRVFRIATADYGVAVAIVRLMARVSKEAPFVEIRVEPFRADCEQALQIGALDLVVAPRRPSGASLVWTTLRSERFVSLVRNDNPKVGRRLDLDTFCTLSHVVVAPEPRAGNPVGDILAAQGRRRHIALRMPSFIVAPLVIADSDMILTAPEGVADRFAKALSLRSLEPPIRLGSISLACGWHERQRKDPGHEWLRSRVAKAAAVGASALTRGRRLTRAHSVTTE